MLKLAKLRCVAIIFVTADCDLLVKSASNYKFVVLSDTNTYLLSLQYGPDL